jgi:YVTN family beta-propeller protein
VVATVPVGSFPDALAVTPDGTHVYVGNGPPLSVIDTATNTVVASVPDGITPTGVAITPDGNHVYVTNEFADSVSVIATATNTVVATIPVPAAFGVAVTPDGTRAYVTSSFSMVAGSVVSVIDTATNTVVAMVPVGVGPTGIAITPDGTKAYVASEGGEANVSIPVSVIDTATNTVVATVPVGPNAFGVAITPDGTRAYVTNFASNNVSVIDTATNTVVATVPAPVAGSPSGIAITSDGTKAYVAILSGTAASTVAVIDTSTNTAVATVPVGFSAVASFGVATFPPVAFSAFSAKLGFHNQNAFMLKSEFTLGSASSGINPPAEAVTLIVGTFATTIPAGSFTGKGYGPFHFAETINGVVLEVAIVPTGAKRYAFHARAQDASLTSTTNPVTVRLTIGDNTGITSVKARISGPEVLGSD